MLDNLRRITAISIPNYIREIETSKSQRPKYFTWNGTTIKAGSKKLWKKCIDSYYDDAIEANGGNVKPAWLHHDYVIAGFKGHIIVGMFMDSLPDEEGKLPKGDLTNTFTKFPSQIAHAERLKATKTKAIKYYLVDVNTLEKVVANPTQVDTPKVQRISGQDFYSNSVHPGIRIKMLEAVHAMYADKFNTIPEEKVAKIKEVFSTHYPLFILCEVQDLVQNDSSNRPWDVPNRAFPYLKTFTDFLVTNKFIEDDDRLHLVGDGNIFTPITPVMTPALVFHIYTDKRRFWETYKQQI